MWVSVASIPKFSWTMYPKCFFNIFRVLDLYDLDQRHFTVIQNNFVDFLIFSSVIFRPVRLIIYSISKMHKESISETNKNMNVCGDLTERITFLMCSFKNNRVVEQTCFCMQYYCCTNALALLIWILKFFF